jgi:hypothetical protein
MNSAAALMTSHNTAGIHNVDTGGEGDCDGILFRWFVQRDHWYGVCVSRQKFALEECH